MHMEQMKAVEDDRTWEISGNLSVLPNYSEFKRAVHSVHSRFEFMFGKEIMDKHPLLIDNATCGSGYTPIITPVLGRYLIIKLNIENFSDRERIIFQVSHELCHYVFYSYLGLNRAQADDREEGICSGMSLCFMKLHSADFDNWCKYIQHHDNLAYRSGYDFANKVEFDLQKFSKELKNVLQAMSNNEYGEKVS